MRNAEQDVARLMTAGLAAKAAVFTARRYNIPVDRLLGPGKYRSIARVRWVAMGAARALGASYPTIGAALGRCHGTVYYGLTRVAQDPDLAQAAEDIAAAVRAS